MPICSLIPWCGGTVFIKGSSKIAASKNASQCQNTSTDAIRWFVSQHHLKKYRRRGKPTVLLIVRLQSIRKHGMSVNEFCWDYPPPPITKFNLLRKSVGSSWSYCIPKEFDFKPCNGHFSLPQTTENLEKKKGWILFDCSEMI